MSDVKPATDQEIEQRTWRGVTPKEARLIARIEAERALNAEMLEAVERGMMNAEAPHSTSCPAQDRVCFCWVREARAAIAKAKAARS